MRAIRRGASLAALSLFEIDPLILDFIKIKGNRLFAKFQIAGRHSVGEIESNRPRLCIQPKLCFLLCLFAMDMHRLVAFVGVKEKTPTKEKNDCRHAFSAP